MKKAAIAALLLLAFSAHAGVNLRGVRSCGQWLEERKVINSTMIGTQSWFVGFLSGLAVGTNTDFLRVDNPSIWAWTDNYCNANPLKDLDDAGVALYFELKQRK